MTFEFLWNLRKKIQPQWRQYTSGSGRKSDKSENSYSGFVVSLTLTQRIKHTTNTFSFPVRLNAIIVQIIKHLSMTFFFFCKSYFVYTLSSWSSIHYNSSRANLQRPDDCLEKFDTVETSQNDYIFRATYDSRLRCSLSSFRLLWPCFNPIHKS